MRNRSTLAWRLAYLLLILPFAPLSAAQQTCPGPPPLAGTANGNIFDEQQDMYLGDAVAQQFERDFRVVPNDELNSYLEKIGESLLEAMPPTKIHFRFVLVDLPEANSFTLPGGHIYVTRKLVAFAQTEDELAGVLGHELGHGLSRQPAASMSRVLHEVLGVNQVGDRADIFSKYNLLIENVARKRIHSSGASDSAEQLVADSYGLYAMSRAGYAPSAMVNFWQRFAETGGKTGSWISDIFGATKPDEQRLRAMKKYIAALPAACIAPRSQTTAEEFHAWQASVVAYSLGGGKASLPGLLWKRELSPPLQSEVTNVKFSSDGRYLLAQDDFSVYVLLRDPLITIFRISADDAEPAAFTPDSKSVLIWTHGLHVELWSVADQKRTSVNEVAIARPCAESAISMDGKVLACVHEKLEESSDFDVELIDVSGGAMIAEKRGFYSPNFGDFFEFFLASLLRGRREFFHFGFSPDGRFFALSRHQTALAWDLNSRAPVKISNAVKEMMSGGFAFVGPNRLVGINELDPKKSGVIQFPEGPAGDRFPLGGNSLSASGHGETFIVRPAGDFEVGVIDLKTGKDLVASHNSALDAYDTIYARQRLDGAIALYDLTLRREIVSTPLPGHAIGRLQGASVSADLKWFAGSGRTRAGVWNLATGERVFHMRGFEGSYFSADDKLAAQFPAFLKEKAAEGILDPASRQGANGQEIGDSRARQYGRYLIFSKHPNGKYNGSVDLETRDVFSSSVLWTKHFSHGEPEFAGPKAGDEIALLSSLSSSAAADEVKANPALKEQVKLIQSKEMANLVQILDLKDGSIRAEFPIDTGKGSFRIVTAVPAEQSVVVTDNRNRVLVYSRDGKLTGRLFGRHPVISPGGDRIAIETEIGTLELYDVATLAKLQGFAFGAHLSHYEFAQSGADLFVLAEDQIAYLVELPKSAATAAH